MTSIPMSNPGSKWQRTSTFRKDIIQKIEEAKQNAERPSSKSSEVIEIHIYNNTKTKNEYLSRLANIISHMNPQKSSLDSVNALNALVQSETENQTMNLMSPQKTMITVNHMPNDKNKWRTSAFRNSIIQKIKEAVKKSGMPTSKSSVEMENYIYEKAKTEEEYLCYVARLILHVREMDSNEKPQIDIQQMQDLTNAFHAMEYPSSS